MGHRNNILRFFAVFGGMNASALLEAGTEKLKAQTRPCRSHAVRRVSFVPLSLFILLSFELRPVHSTENSGEHILSLATMERCALEL